MAYLGRNVNLALLLIIIGIVIAMVGTTVFFQRGLQNRTTAYESTSTALSSCEVALANYQERYEQAQAKVNETSQDIRKYDQLYEQKVGELQDTQGQLASTQRQLEFQELQSEKFQQLYEAQLQVARQQNITISNLRDEIDDLERDLRSCRAELDAC